MISSNQRRIVFVQIKHDKTLLPSRHVYPKHADSTVDYLGSMRFQPAIKKRMDDCDDSLFESFVITN